MKKVEEDIYRQYWAGIPDLPPIEVKAARHNSNKVPYDFLLDLPLSLGELCRVFEKGAEKYERDNWQIGGKPDSEYYACALRHIMKSKKIDFDKETGCHHLAHAVWNLLVLLELNRATILRAREKERLNNDC